jgi:purine-nucleoside phosphorylase
MKNLIKKLGETTDFIKSKTKIMPQLVIVFGSGLSSEELLDTIDIKLSYKDIPYFPVSTVKNHKGELIIGSRNGKNIYLFSGRMHYYEGYSAKEITYPIRVIQYLGAERVILTNAAGGINPDFNAGDIVLMKDHINMIPDHPLRGKNIDELGTRFPDMSQAYDPQFREQIKSIAKNIDYNIKEGVYLAFQGPSLETPAEYTMIYRVGADLIGMSTVLETIVAVHGGMKVGGFSMVSNECFPPERIKETTHQDVVNTVKKSEPVLMSLLGEWIDTYL